MMAPQAVLSQPCGDQPMKQNRISTGRRDFLKAGSLAVVSAAIAGSAGRAAAQAARLGEKGAEGQSPGYKHDASKGGNAKVAKYVAGQNWAKCTFYPSKPP